MKKTKKTIGLFVLVILMGSLNFSCTNTKEGVNTSFLEEEQISEEIEASSEEQNVEYESPVKIKKPNISSETPGVYTKEEIQDIGYRNSRFGFNITLYGRIIDYLGQTTTKEGKDLAFIQSSDRMNFEEKHGAYYEPLYESDLICLGLNSKSEDWNVLDTTQTLWVYHLKQARIKSICSDEKYLYVGTTYRLDADNTNESDLCVICLEKETGKQIWKQPIEGSVSTDMVLHDSKIYFGASLPEEGRIYTLSTKNGTIVQESHSYCREFYSFLSTKDGLYYTTYTYLEPLSLCVLHYSFQTQKETVFWNPVTYSGDYKKSNLLLANSVFYYFIVTYEKDENGEACKGIVVFAVEPNASSPGPNKSKLLWSKKIKIPHAYNIHELLFADDTLYISVGGGEYSTYCIALDTNSQKVLWETCIEGYIVEQASLYFNHLYFIVSPFTEYCDYRFGFIKHDQQVIEIDRTTGEIQAISTKSPYTGVARIVGTYRHNLITQGPGEAYLGFFPID